MSRQTNQFTPKLGNWLPKTNWFTLQNFVLFDILIYLKKYIKYWTIKWFAEREERDIDLYCRNKSTNVFRASKGEERVSYDMEESKIALSIPSNSVDLLLMCILYIQNSAFIFSQAYIKLAIIYQLAWNENTSDVNQRKSWLFIFSKIFYYYSWWLKFKYIAMLLKLSFLWIILVFSLELMLHRNFKKSQQNIYLYYFFKYHSLFQLLLHHRPFEYHRPLEPITLFIKIKFLINLITNNKIYD